MFEVVVLFTSLLTRNVLPYTSLTKYDTMDHCEAQSKVFKMMIDKKLYKLDNSNNPYQFDITCKKMTEEEI